MAKTVEYPWAPEGVLTAEHTAAYRAIARGCSTAQQLAEARHLSPGMAQALIDDLAHARLIHPAK